MPFPPNNDRQRVLDATDLVRLVGEVVTLKPKGKEYMGICPFHEDHDPSLHVVPMKGFYKCFACGAGGSAFDFVMNYYRMDFREALTFLAERAGVTLTPWKAEREARGGAAEVSGTEIIEAHRTALAFYRMVLAHPTQGAEARKIFAERGISEEMIERFELGATFGPAAMADCPSADHAVKIQYRNAGSDTIYFTDYAASDADILISRPAELSFSSNWEVRIFTNPETFQGNDCFNRYATDIGFVYIDNDVPTDNTVLVEIMNVADGTFIYSFAGRDWAGFRNEGQCNATVRAILYGDLTGDISHSAETGRPIVLTDVRLLGAIRSGVDLTSGSFEQIRTNTIEGNTSITAVTSGTSGTGISLIRTGFRDTEISSLTAPSGGSADDWRAGHRNFRFTPPRDDGQRREHNVEHHRDG